MLASHRPDETLAADSAHIVEDAEDAEQFPSVAPGELAINEWLRDRIAGTAHLRGRFVDITAAETVAYLHPQFKPRARTYGLKYFDAAALKSADNRSLTQEVAQTLWARRSSGGANLCDGIQFRSRHGDDLLLWAIFERESDGQISSRLSGIETLELEADTPELVTAMALLGITALEKH